MDKYIDKIIEQYELTQVPVRDVMGFKVVAGGALAARLKFAAFAADQYWNSVKMALEKDKLAWQKYIDRYNAYLKEKQLWYQDKWAKMDYAAKMAGINSRSYGGGGGGGGAADMAAAQNRRTQELAREFDVKTEMQKENLDRSYDLAEQWMSQHRQQEADANKMWEAWNSPAEANKQQEYMGLGGYPAGDVGPSTPVGGGGGGDQFGGYGWDAGEVGPSTPVNESSGGGSGWVSMGGKTYTLSDYRKGAYR